MLESLTLFILLGPLAGAILAGFGKNMLGDKGAMMLTTGIMMIDLLATSGMAGLRLYGFDFFASLSLSGPRTKADVGHNFDGEAAFVADLSARDPRIVHRR